MNIWTLRNKLKANMERASVQAAPVQAPVAVHPQISGGLNALLTDEPEVAPVVAIQTENLGLNDLFDMNDSDIRSISPKLTFSDLKKPH